MNEHEKHFEDFLREFQPRRPRALPPFPNAIPVWTRRFAAAAVVTIAFGISAWFLVQRPVLRENGVVLTNQSVASVTKTPRGVPSTALLTRLALESPSGLDGALEAAPDNRLPRFDRQDSALRVLAKE